MCTHTASLAGLQLSVTFTRILLSQTVCTSLHIGTWYVGTSYVLVVPFVLSILGAGVTTGLFRFTVSPVGEIV